MKELNLFSTRKPHIMLKILNTTTRTPFMPDSNTTLDMKVSTANDQELVFSTLESLEASSTQTESSFINCSYVQNCLKQTENIFDLVENELKPIESLMDTKTLWMALILFSSK